MTFHSPVDSTVAFHGQDDVVVGNADAESSPPGIEGWLASSSTRCSPSYGRRSAVQIYFNRVKCALGVDGMRSGMYILDVVE